MLGMLDSVASPLQESIKTAVGDPFITPLTASLGAEAFEKALVEGRAMSARQAVQYAQMMTARGSG